MKHARYEEHAAGLAQKMSDYFIALRRQVRRHRVTVVSVMCVVVFATTYALILPAVTIDKNTASNEPGMSVEAATDAADSNAETISSDQQAAGSLISEPTTMEYKGEDYKVEAAVDADAQLPEGTTLKVQEVTEASDPEAYASYSQKALEQAKEKDSSVQSLSSARFFDISFVKADGSEMEPSADVAITLNYDDTQEVSDASKVSVVHIADDGAASAVDPEKVDVDAPDGKLSSVEFKASSFSIYAIVDTGDTTKTKEYRRTYTFQNDDGSDYTFSLDKNPASAKNETPVAKTTNQQIVRNGGQLLDVGIPEAKTDANKGRKFLGWGVVKSDGTVDTTNPISSFPYKVNMGSDVTADDSVTLRAVFDNNVNITFHDETGAVIAIKQVGKTKTVDISDVTTDGTGDVVLAGWTTTETTRTQNPDGSYTSNTTAKIDYGTDSISNVSADTNLWPVFQAAHWLTFKSNDGGDGSATYIAPVRYASGETTEKPSDPQRQGYTFGGWYTDENCTTAFSFGSTLSDNQTVYAKWTPDETTYTVIIWRQQVGDDKNADDAAKTYDYAESSTVSAHTGDTVNGSSSALSQYENRGGTRDYKGFEYASSGVSRTDSTTDVTVKGDGSSVINVYYDRQHITMNFVYDGSNQYVYKETTSYSVYGTYYGLVGNKYVRIYLNNNDGKWYTSRRWSIFGYTYEDEYDGKLYTRSYEYVDGKTTTFTGLYGQPLSKYNYTWPASDGPWIYYSSKNTIGMSFLGQFVLPGVQSGDGQNETLIKFHRDGSVGNYYYFYLQNADGSWPSKATDEGSTESGGTFYFSEKYDNYNVVSYKLNSSGSDGSTGNWEPTNASGSLDMSNISSLGIRYERKSYNIEFFNGKTQLDSDVSKRYEASLSDVSEPKDLTYPGNSDDASHYEFVGWFADPQLTTYVSFGSGLSDQEKSDLQAKYPSITNFVTYETMPGHNLPVYAGWKPKRYHVTLDVNGGTLPDGTSADFYVDYKEQLSSNLQTLPSRDGYEFLGWMVKNSDGTMGNAWNFDAGVDRNLTLVAKWRATGSYRVRYVNDSATTTNKDVLYTDTSAYFRDSSTVTTIAWPTTNDSGNVNIVPAGYQFAGWKYGNHVYTTGENFTISIADAGEDYRGTDNGTNYVYVYAVYTKIDTTYITYDANGGSGTLTDVEQNDNIQRDIPLNTATTLSEGTGFTRAGYQLIGWNTDQTAATNGAVEWKLGEKVGVDGHANTLYAVWKKTANILVKKTNADGSEALTGAEFTLEMKNSNGTYESVKNYTKDNPLNVSTTVGIEVDDLNDGEYRLTEIKAPDGYVVSTSATEFTVQDGKVSQNGTELKSEEINGKTVYTISIPNTAGNPLPNTGGMGTMMYSAAGAALVLLSVALGFVLRRRNHGKGGC